MKGGTLFNVVCVLLYLLCAHEVSARDGDGCPTRADCVPRHRCKHGTVRPRDPRACRKGSRDNLVCCLQVRGDKYDKISYGMDYYDDRFGKSYSSPLSKFAKEVLHRYRQRDECGVRFHSPKDLARVSTGYISDRGLTSFGEFPWHVALLVRERHHHLPFVRRLTTYRYHCGATLIHPILLLTAAHCVKGLKKNRLKAHLGEWNLYSTSGELFPAIERRITKVFIHSGYSPATFLNDIALLQMDRPVDLSKTPHIAPACLPDDSYKFKDDQKCYVVGWGDDVYKPILGSNILKAVSVTYATEEECADRLYASIPHISDDYIFDTDSLKCIIGGYGRDACTGDGGGAVVCPLDNTEGPDACDEHDCEDEHYFVAGIVSFGTPVCGEDSITIVTDIVEKVNWIHTIISPAGGLKNYNYGFYDKDVSYKKRTAGTADPQTANNTIQ